MPLKKGHQLGHYEILEPLGAGGMGEVYRARDPRLDREVAIKVLPSHLADNPEFRQRFEREARTISNLNHPNICTLHDVGEQDGVHYLVMELLEGETLAQRLEKGPLPPKEALALAVPIADALDRAHRSGVVHRDLKPGNIMLTKSGPKLLDFGLATAGADAAGPISSMAMTGLSPLTAEGTIVGTFQYMSPEQLEGKPADPRSDLFAFGAVLYEMVAGKKAFEADSQASLIVAVMSTEPPALSSVVPLSPPALDRVVSRCLAKKPEERWHSAADLASELKWIAGGGSDAHPAPGIAAARQRGTWRGRIGWMAAAVALLLAGLFLGLFLGRGDPPRPLVASLNPPPGWNFEPGSPVAISPDSRRVAFVASSVENRPMLWVRDLDSSEARLLDGTEGASYPFWSPDSNWLAFYAGGKLNKIDIRGGPVIPLCGARQGRSGSWNRDGVIIFQPRFSESLHRVSAAGGTPAKVTQLNPDRFEIAHRWPQFLPDGRHFLFFVVSSTNPSSSEHSGVYIGSLDSTETRQLLRVDSRARYAANYLWYRRGTTLMAQHFDTDRLELEGDPIPFAGKLFGGAISWGGAYFGLSDQVLAHLSGEAGLKSELTWFDRQGKVLGTIGAPDDYWAPRLSNDGHRVAMSVGNESGDLWLHHLERDTRTRFTFDPANDVEPVWSPDDSHVAFGTSRERMGELYQRASSGVGQEELLYSSGTSMSVSDWSGDGRHILFSSLDLETGWDLWSYVVDDAEARPILVSDFDQYDGVLSPDGRWLAYTSNESDRNDVYVQGFPESSGRWMISTGGGSQPRWRKDGREIFYIAPNDTFMAVPVQAESSFTFGTPLELFQTRTKADIGGVYDVTADGQRFLVNILPVDLESRLEVVLVLNWTEALSR